MFSLKARVRGATVAASLDECIKWCVCVCLSERRRRRRRGLGKMLGCYDDGGGGQDDLILNCVSTAVTDAH